MLVYFKTLSVVFISNSDMLNYLQKIQVDRKLKTGVRVTVKKSETSTGKLTGLVVSPDTPRTEDGTYWGYQVRYASAFRKILHGTVN